MLHPLVTFLPTSVYEEWLTIVMSGQQENCMCANMLHTNDIIFVSCCKGNKFFDSLALLRYRGEET